MGREIRVVGHPRDLDNDWDELGGWYYMKKEFLCFLHQYNYCRQVYYELFTDGRLAAGTIVYPFRTNILTFSRLNLFVHTKIIGLPISIATVPKIGDDKEFEILLSEILERERGLLLGLNFTRRYMDHRLINMRTLPTFLLEQRFGTFEQYLESLRHPYRRRLNRFMEKFHDVQTEITSCACFNKVHYRLYLDVMDKSTTKLETLSLDLFRNLPGNFILTTHYIQGSMLAWHICMCDHGTIFYFMGGLNYESRDRYGSYHNNLISILRYAYSNGYARVDLGQTADVAKRKIGGIEEERIMFLYHRNPILFVVLRLARKAFEYLNTVERNHVFRDYAVSREAVKETSQAL